LFQPASSSIKKKSPLLEEDLAGSRSEDTESPVVQKRIKVRRTGSDGGSKLTDNEPTTIEAVVAAATPSEPSTTDNASSVATKAPKDTVKVIFKLEFDRVEWMFGYARLAKKPMLLKYFIVGEEVLTPLI